MIEKERVINMTKAALYEQKEKKHALHRLSFFKSDYVVIHMLSIWICISVALAIALGVAIICLTESAMNYSFTQWISFAVLAVVIYGTVTIVYLLIAWNVYAGRYEEAEESVLEYERYLAELKE